ncbi:hypothetical protein [Singulisphaera sp. PoT]|uniref:hypothetical protein n=1 Tax=Singulisphaera sp. PoT TaxID=3411797 RepID=UPI003BF61E79
MTVNQLSAREGLEPLPLAGDHRPMQAVRYAELMNLAIKQFQTTITRRFEQATFRLSAEAFHSPQFGGWTPMSTASQVRNTITHPVVVEPIDRLDVTAPGEIRENPARILDRVILGKQTFAICSFEGTMSGHKQVPHAVIMPAEEYRRLTGNLATLTRIAGELIENAKAMAALFGIKS